MPTRDIIQGNLALIQQRIAAACDRVGRLPQAVRLVAVTKYAPLDWVRELIALGQRDLGESRPQQLAQRATQLRSQISDFRSPSEISNLRSPIELRDMQLLAEDAAGTQPDSPVCWHLIGHLQRNKAELAVRTAALIHSVDSLRLLDQLEHEARRQQLHPRVLLEVNVSGEGSKDGFNPDDLRASSLRLAEYSAVQIEGLMTMAPHSNDAELARPVFAALRELRGELTTLSDGRLNIPQLSMGMSGDFEIAIEEGATLVRIGSSLFEGC